MRKRDVPLVFFTILSQWSIGLVLCLAVLTLLHDSLVPGVETGLSLANPVLLALLMVVIATAMSFLHLGRPANAAKSIRNLATSWLSREILAIGLFSVGLLLVLAQAAIFANPVFSGPLLLVASLAGLLLLWTMIGVYRIPTVPAWHSHYTVIAFSLAALNLGMVACLAFSMAGLLEPGQDVTVGLASLLVLTLVLEGVFSYLNQRRLVAMDTGFNGPVLDRGILKALYRLRMALLLLTAMVTLLAVTGLVPPVLLAAALLLAVSQEVIGRVLFYASYFRLGM